MATVRQRGLWHGAALGVKLGAKCLIAWRFSRLLRLLRPVRPELMELVEWKEL